MLQKSIRWNKAAGLAVVVQIFLFTCLTVFAGPKSTSASQDRTKRSQKIVTEKVSIATIKAFQDVVGTKGSEKTHAQASQNVFNTTVPDIIRIVSQENPPIQARQIRQGIVKTTVPGIMGTESQGKPKHEMKKIFVKQGNKVMMEITGTEGPERSSIDPMKSNMDTYAVEGGIFDWVGGTDEDGDDFYETYDFWVGINADAIPGPVEVCARLICVTTEQGWYTNSWIVEGDEEDWRYVKFDETYFPSITGNTTLDWIIEIWTSDNSVFLAQNTDVYNENLCKVDYVELYDIDGKIGNFVGGMDEDGDDFYETYNFLVAFKVTAIPGPVSVYVVARCLTVGLIVVNTTPITVSGREQNWHYYYIDETYINELIDRPTILDWRLEVWDSSLPIRYAINDDLVNEDACKVNNLWPVVYGVFGKIDSWVGGTDADGDGFYETYSFRVGIDADAVPYPKTVYGRLICETTGQDWWMDSSWIVSGIDTDYVYKTFDETDFPSIQDNTNLDWTVEIWNDPDKLGLIRNTNVENEAWCKVDPLPQYSVNGKIDNWVGGTDADGDGFYETYDFRVGIDANAVPGPETVNGKLICVTTGQEWWLPSSWSVSGTGVDYNYKTFDETDFPSIQDNTTLDWTVEMWDASKSTRLAIDTEVTDEALCRVDTPGEVLISIPTGLSCQALPGATFTAPVNVSDLTGKNVFSYTMVITFDATRLEATGVDVSGAISSAWGPPTSTPASGQITIAGAGTSALSGSGTLVNVNMRVNPGYTPATNETIDIHIQSAQLNEGSPSATTSDGSVIFRIPVPAYISGMVKYYQADRPISNTTVNLSGDAVQNQVTGSSGTYQFTGLSTGQNYQVSAAKTGGQESGIAAYDASLILRYVVGIESLSGDQLTAADASGNGSATQYDASIILRYVVGIDVSTTVIGHWLFSPNTHSYSPLSGDQTNQDFTGILIGDVSGNWPGTTVAKSTGGSVVLGEAYFNSEGLLELPIGMEGLSSCYSAGVELEIEADRVSVESVVMFEEPDEAILVYREDAGKLRIALASSESLKDGDLLKVLFRVDGESITEEIPITMTAYTLDERLVDDLHEVVSVARAEFPTAFELKPNYPNPFNPVTHFVYTLPERSDVEVHIYNMMGQRVRELVQADQEAGKYEVIWDGRDDMGFELPSGVYFVIYRAAQYNRSMKIIKMK